MEQAFDSLASKAGFRVIYIMGASFCDMKQHHHGALCVHVYVRCVQTNLRKKKLAMSHVVIRCSWTTSDGTNGLPTKFFPIFLYGRFFSTKKIGNASLAAPGALVHLLQHCTPCKIQNGRIPMSCGILCWHWKYMEKGVLL